MYAICDDTSRVCFVLGFGKSIKVVVICVYALDTVLSYAFVLHCVAPLVLVNIGCG
jgi:hypothetical protein